MHQSPYLGAAQGGTEGDHPQRIRGLALGHFKGCTGGALTPPITSAVADTGMGSDGSLLWGDSRDLVQEFIRL